MSQEQTRPKAGVLALTLELYETLAPGLRGEREAWLRREVLPALAKEADVVFEGAVFRREDVDRAVAGLEAQGVDAIVVILLTYSPSQIALPALKAARAPVFVWNTQELYAVDGSFDGPKMTANHGVHGTQDLCNTLLRSGVAFEYATTHLRDANAAAPVNDFLRAAAAARRLRSARIGLMGYPFPGMGDFAVDTTQLAATLGCQWVHLSVEDYIRRAEAAPGAEAAGLAAEYRRLYDVSAAVTQEELEATARAELALRGMARDNRLDALTYQFMAFGEDERTATLPFVAISRMMAEGLGFGGEGDIIAAAGSALLGWLHPPATFSEIFTVDFAGDSLMMSHMGEANVAMARPDRKTRLAARPAPITRTRQRQLELVTALRPGAATLFALTLGPGARWRMIATGATVEDFGPLEALCAPHFKLAPAAGAREFLTAYAKAGGPHHNAVCFGDARPRLRLAAGMLGADYIEV